MTGHDPRLPATPAARDRWIMDRRTGIPRDPGLDPWKAGGWQLESEPDAAGIVRDGLTVFLTNRECPWRCLMCDLWRHALPDSVPVGAIPAQLDGVFRAVGRDPTLDWIKLYNAGSFFDRAAIPTADHGAIAERCGPFGRVVVECHPSLVAPRVTAFRDLLRPGTRLEVGLGLETIHPETMERLNKRVTPDGFARAARFLKSNDCDVRAFVLVQPPFLDGAMASEWTQRTVEFAFDCGVDVVALIPTRFGNGALESLAADGDFAPPSIEALETAMVDALAMRRGRVFADLWDLGKFEKDPGRVASANARLERMNRTQSTVAA